MAEKKALSYELNQDMLALIRREFDIEKVVTRFSEAIANKSKQQIEEIGKEIFAEYGRDLIQRTLQLGEEYPDRTYEVLKEAIDQLGGYYKFALLPQRFLEIAYSSILELANLPVMENSPRRLAYRITDCPIYKSLTDKCGKDVAKLMVCKHVCLTAMDVLHQGLDLDAVASMEASLPKSGYCQFSASKSL
ncbi:MAG: hypothetical protein ISS52_02990 [Dehalococcoidia bacterium]|nr:hypothetical protein [Dehalococcoidia bacterium]